MGLFSSDDRALSRYEFRALQRRLAELHQQCNPVAAAAEEAVYAVTPEMLAGKTVYEQDEVRLAVALKEFRDTLQREESLRKDKTPEQQLRNPDLAALRQALRRQDIHLRELQRGLVQSAKTDVEKSRAKEALTHLGNMRRRYDETKQSMMRSAFTTGGDERAEVGAFPPPSPDRGDRNSPLVVHNLEDIGRGTNIREDEEFVQFFDQLARNDRAMEDALDRIARGVAVLGENAKMLNQELKIQNVLLDETSTKVEKTTAKVASLNRRVQRTVKEVNKDKMCIYVICLILVIALVGIIVYSTGVVKT